MAGVGAEGGPGEAQAGDEEEQPEEEENAKGPDIGNSLAIVSAVAFRVLPFRSALT